MRAAVVGGGVFGCLAAIELANVGMKVDLYERHADIMYGATRSCQCRLHRGYHYPRARSTALACKESFGSFMSRYSAATTAYRHYYIIANGADTLTSGQQFIDFCDDLELPYEKAKPPMLIPRAADLCVRVPEAIVNPKMLRVLVRRDLVNARVTVYTDAPADPYRMPSKYDRVVDCTYGAYARWPLRYEICETALIRLGKHFEGRSFVVMDGPFVSLDPVPGTNLHMLYHVDESVHAAEVGDLPKHATIDLCDRGPLFTGLTHADNMQLSLRRFLDGVGMPEYRGSMFTVRAVLPDVDATDERPTQVVIEGKVTTVLSGKIGTAVRTARLVAQNVIESI